MDSSSVNTLIVVGTLLTALGTIALAAIAWIAAKFALSELKLANRQLKLSAEQAALATTQLEQSRELADAAVRRQRAEVTHTAIRRFIKQYAEQHLLMLAEARKITAKREDSSSGGDFVRCRISDLFEADEIKAGRTPDIALNALQSCLDSLEELAVGVELQVYDPYVVYHSIYSTIHRLVDWSEHFINLQRQGGVPNRAAQESAYKMLHLLDIRLTSIASEGAPTKLAGALDD